MVDGELLHDHAAHRQPHHVRPFDTGRVEHGDRVDGHVGEPVGGTLLVERGVDEVGRQTDIPVVEPDHVEAGVDEHHTPVLVVVDALRTESVDQQQRRVVR